MVGDSSNDVLAGRDAGCWSCLAGWGVPPGERDVEAVVPDIVVEHPAALLGLLVGP